MTHQISIQLTDSTTTMYFKLNQGPEWLWPMGFFLISKIRFNKFETKQELHEYIYYIISSHAEYLKFDSWRGLPELMNKENIQCPGSCKTQAWSVATLLEALFNLDNY